MLSPEAVHEIMNEVDHNRDGKIDYAEFCAMILPRWVPWQESRVSCWGYQIYRTAAMISAFPLLLCCNSEAQERPAGMLGAMRTSLRASRRAQPHLLPQDTLRLREAPLVDSVLEEERVTEEEVRDSAQEGSDWVAGIQVPSRSQYAKAALMAQQQQHSDVSSSSVLLSGFTSCAPSSDGRPSATATDGPLSLASLDGHLGHAGAEAPLWGAAPNGVAAMIKEVPESAPAGTLFGGEEEV